MRTSLIQIQLLAIILMQISLSYLESNFSILSLIQYEKQNSFNFLADVSTPIFELINFFKIDLRNNYTIVITPDLGTNTLNPYSFTAPTQIGNINANSALISSNLRIGEKHQNLTIKDFPVYFIPRMKFNNFYEYGCFGFASYFNDDNFSILHQLKRQSLINNLSFGFDIKNYNDKSLSYFYLGGIPNDRLILYPNKANIKILPNTHEWRVSLPKIQIMYGNKIIGEYSNTHNNYFNTYHNKILVPDDFLLFLFENAFKEYFANNTCSFHNNSQNQYIECDYFKVGNYFPVISFNIGKYLFKLNKKDLFEGNMFNIQRNYIDDGRGFLIGSCFIGKYITLFDMEKREITFYYKNSSIYVDIEIESFEKYKKLVLVFLEIVIILSCVSILMLLSKVR